MNRRAVVAAAVTALLLCAAGPARAAKAPNPANQASLDKTVSYLQKAQNADGGFGGSPGTESDPDFSAWVALALAAAGINPQDQVGPGGVDVFAYLLGHTRELTAPNAECTHSSCTSELERVLLVVDAAGTSPHDFGGVDLVNEILERKLGDGSFPHETQVSEAGMNDTIFAILSLSLVHEPAVEDAVQQATQWLQDQQNEDGSWSALSSKLHQGEVDMTAAAVEALNAAGDHNTPAQQKAFEYLHKAQRSDGGFPELLGEEESNVASTAWTAQAIWSAGENPEAWKTSSGTDPLQYMASLQQEDGHIRWRKNQDMNGVWMTAYVTPAFAGRALPPAVVPRSKQPEQPAKSDDGVIAGGGGNGAPLFSQPQPQSKGKKRGGVRVLSSTRARAAERDAAKRHHAHQRQTSAEHTTPASHKSEIHRSHDSRNPATAAIASDSTLNRGRPGGGVQADRGTVKGVLIGGPGSSRNETAPAAAGLRSAAQDSGQSSWTAIAIACLIGLLALAGSQLERKRAQVVL